MKQFLTTLAVIATFSIIIVLAIPTPNRQSLKQGTVENIRYGEVCKCWMVKVNGKYLFTDTKPDLQKGAKIFYKEGTNFLQ